MQEVDTKQQGEDDIRPYQIGKIFNSGGAKTATVPSEYADFIGVDEGTHVKWRPYCGPHGNYLVLHKLGEQPEEGTVEGIFIAHNELKEVEGDASSIK